MAKYIDEQGLALLWQTIKDRVISAAKINDASFTINGVTGATQKEINEYIKERLDSVHIEGGMLFQGTITNEFVPPTPEMEETAVSSFTVIPYPTSPTADQFTGWTAGSPGYPYADGLEGITFNYNNSIADNVKTVVVTATKDGNAVSYVYKITSRTSTTVTFGERLSEANTGHVYVKTYRVRKGYMYVAANSVSKLAMEPGDAYIALNDFWTYGSLKESSQTLITAKYSIIQANIDGAVRSETPSIGNNYTPVHLKNGVLEPIKDDSGVPITIHASVPEVVGSAALDRHVAGAGASITDLITDYSVYLPETYNYEFVVGVNTSLSNSKLYVDVSTTSPINISNKKLSLDYDNATLGLDVKSRLAVNTKSLITKGGYIGSDNPYISLHLTQEEVDSLVSEKSIIEEVDGIIPLSINNLGGGLYVSFDSEYVYGGVARVPSYSVQKLGISTNAITYVVGDAMTLSEEELAAILV